ncbi:peroxisomal membrane anchor protein conserved region-domain-containing protein [Auriculariales sp. MPI-PUGE-AT-0066]|nr:peroxisomal membrane anchor protein conserved region-domain-containing protein [Auriculariales sp. MPI-PUGE-AT-0066]
MDSGSIASTAATPATLPEAAPALRNDLIKNAVAFLNDPKIQSSPVAKRVEFLQTKGLTAAEIDEALGQAPQSAPIVSQPVQPAHTSVSPYVSQQFAFATQPPLVPQLDWRDYFVMAVVSGGVMYGVAALARKFLWPHLQPPASTAYEADRDAMQEQFDKVAALVADMHADSAASRTAAEKQQAEVERVTQDVEDAIREMRMLEAKADNELREIRNEVDSIKELLPKMMDKSRDAQTQSLADLRAELASLKSLLLTLGPGPASGASSPAPVAVPIPRPSIPAWQLAGPNSRTPSASGTGVGTVMSPVATGKTPTIVEPDEVSS